MQKLTKEEINELFDKEFPPEMSYMEMSEKLCLMNNEHIDELRFIFCNLILDVMVRGFYRWKSDFNQTIKNTIAELFIKQERLLKSKNYFFEAVAAFFEQDYSECLNLLDEYYSDTEIITVTVIDFDLLPVFKQSFSGFWQHMREFIIHKKSEPGVLEYIDAIEAYYTASSFEIIIEKCSKVLQIDSKSAAIRELLARIYVKNKMWNNAIAYYEQINEPCILYQDDLYFDMAWAYGKAKEIDKAIEYYQKCIEISPAYHYANNNLGWLYIKKNKFDKAINVLEKCLNESCTYDEQKYAANNLVIAYIGAKEIDKAEKFVAESKIKLWKTTLNKLEAVKDKNDTLLDKETESEEHSIKSLSKHTDMNTQQFSSEKILEDELELRIESGKPVFGTKLKIYKRKGEYGRQYIIPVGRIDLLAEDSNGNLYVIELKKDSGYDDAYKQIVSYIDWFEKNKKSSEQQIYGIICLNNPSKELIKSTKKDKRIKLYEYTISYTEIK
ncbi:MAG: endonuclease NucS domain-containing protein [Candidatus Ornithomonoglobus sp.]